MNSRLLSLLAAATLAASVAASSPTSAQSAPHDGGSRHRGEYRNPVLNRDFPDPDVIQAANGAYYAYGTEHDAKNRHINIQVAKSRDLVHWNYLGDAMPSLPDWG